MEVVGFKAAFGRRRFGKQYLEHPSGNSYHALIVAHADSELDCSSVGIPSGVRRKAEEHGPAKSVPLTFSEHAMRCTRVSSAGLSASVNGTQNWKPLEGTRSQSVRARS